MNSLGKKIKYHLKMQNKNLKYLAKELDVPQGKLSRWINGHADMPSSILCRISRILGVSMDELMGDDDDNSRRSRDRAKDRELHGRAEHIGDRHSEEAESSEDTGCI